MQALGMDGMSFLTTEDPIYALSMQIVMEKTREFVRKLDRDRARQIANEVGHLFKGKR